MATADNDTDDLLAAVVSGDKSAAAHLLERHRDRLKRMVIVRIDQRLKGRLDASDVVQDVFIEAYRRLDEYAHTRPLAFYPWLRKLAWDRLVDVHRRHLQAQRRSVEREMVAASSHALVDFLADSEYAPLGRLLRTELCERVQRALTQLSEDAREVLVLRFVEQLTIRDAAQV